MSLLRVLILFSLYHCSVLGNTLNFHCADDYVRTTCPSVLGSGSRTVQAWVRSNSAGENAINLENLPSGIYFLKIELMNGSVFDRKLVKSKG